jgi:hypothetical protein
MKQVFQDLKTGETCLTEVPRPSAGPAFSRGRGVDGVLVTASTSSDEPIRQAANMCRKRAWKRFWR